MCIAWCYMYIHAKKLFHYTTSRQACGLHAASHVRTYILWRVHVYKTVCLNDKTCLTHWCRLDFWWYHHFILLKSYNGHFTGRNHTSEITTVIYALSSQPYFALHILHLDCALIWMFSHLLPFLRQAIIIIVLMLARTVNNHLIHDRNVMINCVTNKLL